MFRLVNVNGRAALERDDRWFDLAELSGDTDLADPLAAIARANELHTIDERCEDLPGNGSISEVVLGPPVPHPRQVFAIGLNYLDHAREGGMELPPAPLTFTKFPTCIAGPTDQVPLTSGSVDWEAELVIVIGRASSHIREEQAWDIVAGLTLGQDISDRGVQLTGSPPQFCLGKSFPGFGPIGPAVVPVDAFEDPDDIGLWCDVSGERVQEARTSQLIFSVPTLLTYLSSICTLLPGDLIFSGTPAGVGMARGRFLREGDVITTGAETIGVLENHCVAGRPPATAVASGTAPRG
jgi:2,4-didehydro-3-deoxy-L-rhamnonate hydrolase